MPDAREAVLRSAEPRDAAAIAALMTELGHPLTEAQGADRIAFVARCPDHELTVAELGGEVVAFIAYRVLESVESVEPFGWITALSVTARFKRQGLGTRLLEHFENRMREQGIRKLRVISALHRKEDAHVFYQARGWEPSGLRFAKDLGAD